MTTATLSPPMSTTGLLSAVVARADLATALSIVVPVVPTKTTLPALACVLLSIVDGPQGPSLELAGTDLDVSMRHRIAIKSGTAGRLAVPAKKLQEMVRELSSGDVKLTAKAGPRLIVEAGKAKFTIQCLPADEFPMPAKDLPAMGNIPAKSLHALAEFVSFAASTEESRPILNGVLLEVRADRLNAVATNGHRLMFAGVALAPDTMQGGNQDMILLPKMLAHLKRAAAPDATLQLSGTSSHLQMATDTTEITARLVEGPYPNYAQVIPKAHTKTTVVDKASLASALKRVAIVASDDTHRIKIAIADGMSKISATTPDLGDAEDTLPTSHTGEPIEVGVNATYFTEILAHIPGTQVRITTGTPEQAICIFPVDAPADVFLETVSLVMPLRLM